MGQETGWKPMAREEFAELERDDQLRDRKGRVWRVVTEPYEREGWPTIVIRSGDLVRHVPDRWADDYMRLPPARPT
jgi:hypothetical protein